MAVPSAVAKSTVTVLEEAELNVTVVVRDTAVSSGVVKSAIDNDGEPSSSVIVSSPTHHLL